MLESLKIKNVALIDELEINFGEKLNILTGETGAGKSIIIDSIGFVLGQKQKTTMIRANEEYAEVIGVFNIQNDEVLKEIKKFGINIDEDQILILHRKILKNGKNTIKANGETINLTMLKEVGSILVDIHGQHEHQLLMNSTKHIGILDRFCGEELFFLKDQLKQLYNRYLKIDKSINDLKTDEKDRQTKIEIYEYQINEIGSAKLKQNEEDILMEEKKILQSTEKIKNNAEKSLGFLQKGFFDNDSAISQIGSATNLIFDISKIDKSLTKMYERLEAIRIELEDISFELRDYNEEINHNPIGLEEIEIRLGVIYNLKRKYGSNIDEILKFLEKVENEKVNLLNSNNNIEKLLKEKHKINDDILEASLKLSKIRKKVGILLEKEIEDVLKELGMKDVRFKISILKLENFREDGFDKVEFLISANQGEDLKPLSEIASGGEMSRIMLALKTVLSKESFVLTYIFDEIDTGVSGRTAQKVAEKLNILSKSHQIICITHLAQIAAMSDEHFLIEKNSYENKTKTNVLLLKNENVVNEIARLIGGAIITEKTIKAASEMIMLAKDLK